jgi:hypothetical protein
MSLVHVSSPLQLRTAGRVGDDAQECHHVARHCAHEGLHLLSFARELQLVLVFVVLRGEWCRETRRGRANLAAPPLSDAVLGEQIQHLILILDPARVELHMMSG